MKSYFICCFLLLISFIGVPSEKRLVDRESCALLFENVTANNSEKEVSLYINGAKKPSLIVIWKLENKAITAEWRMKNYTKIFMDANRNIRIANIDETYEGKYYIQCPQIREVELTISGSLTDEISEEITRWLKDLQGFIMKYFGNLTDEIREEITEKLDDHHFGNCDSTSGYMIAAILVIVTMLLVVSVLVQGPEVWKMLKNAWSWCRKCVKTSNTRPKTEQRGGTDYLMPRLPAPPIDNSETEDDFRPTAQGKNKIDIRETETDL